jgi:predicted dehydrogenase
MLRFGLVGCGRIGIRHARLLKEIKNVELTAVCDINEKKAKDFSDKFKIPYYTDYIKMVKSEKIDVVNICTPSGLHSEHTIDIAPFVNNIIVEKPIALTVAGADKMIEVCDLKGTRLFVVKQNRFNLPIIKLREAIDQDRFGSIYLVTVRVHWRRTQKYYDMDDWHGTWAMDGGVLTNQASHHIDMLQWILGPIKSVSAMTDTFLHNIEVEDTGVAILRARSGALGIIEATTNTSPEDLEGSVNVYGSNGTVEIGGFAMNRIVTWKFDKMRESDNDVIEKYSENPADVYGFGHHAYLKNVIENIENNGSPLIDGIEGRKTVKIIQAIYESAETGKQINLSFDSTKSKLGEKK